MKNRVKSNVQMTYPMVVSREFSDDFSNWPPTPSGPQRDSYPFPIQQDQWDLEDWIGTLNLLLSTKYLPRWVTNGAVGFLLCSVTCPRQCVLGVLKDDDWPFISHFIDTILMLSRDDNSTNPHNEELLSRGKPVERGVFSHSLFSHVCLWLYYSSKPITLRTDLWLEIFQARCGIECAD